MTDAAPPIRELRALEAAARLGSLGLAAAELGVTQPAASLLVRRLEQRLGASLLERGPRGSAASAAGERFAQRVRRVLDEIAAALGASGGTPGALRRLTDPQLAAHEAVAAAGSFAAAARAQGQGLPAVQRAARGLERAAGVALYRRGPAGTAVNEAGLELARRLGLARAELAQGLAELRSGGARLAIGTLPLVPRAPLVAAVGSAGQGLALSLIEGGYEELVAQLRAGRLDLVLGMLRAPAGGELLERPLLPDPYRIVGGTAHRLAGRRATPAQLAACGWVVPAAGMPRRAVVEALFAALPRRPALVIETSSLDMTLALLREGQALALLSEGQVAAQGGLAALRGGPLLPRRVVGVTQRARWWPTPAQQAFLDALFAAGAAQAASGRGGAR